MKLYKIAKQEVGGYNWNKFVEHWYCGETNCHKIFHVLARGKRNSNICSDCGEEMTQITKEMIESSKRTNNEPLIFTKEERKEILDDWEKDTKRVPTWEAILKREERAKRTHQTFASV